MLDFLLWSCVSSAFSGTSRTQAIQFQKEHLPPLGRPSSPTSSTSSWLAVSQSSGSPSPSPHPQKFRYASGRVEELGFGEPDYNVTAYEINNVRTGRGGEGRRYCVSQVTRAFDDCLDRTCNYGAAVDQQMMEVCSSKPSGSLHSCTGDVCLGSAHLRGLLRRHPLVSHRQPGWSAQGSPGSCQGQALPMH